MIVVNVHEAKAQLSKLLDAVLEGKQVLLARSNRIIAELVPRQRPALQLGGFEGEIEIADDFDSPQTNAMVQNLFELDQ